MAHKRHKPEEIVQKLRQVDVLVGQGMQRVDAIREVRISGTFGEVLSEHSERVYGHPTCGDAIHENCGRVAAKTRPRLRMTPIQKLKAA